MFLLNEDSYISVIAMTYAISEHDDSKIRNIFENLVEKTPTVEISDLFAQTTVNEFLTIDEYKKYYYFSNAVYLSRKQKNSVHYEIKIEKLYRALFPDIFKLVNKNKIFDMKDYLFLLNEAKDLTAKRKFVFGNRLVALMFFVLNKWGATNRLAYEFGKALFNISLEDKNNVNLLQKIDKPLTNEVINEKIIINSFFNDENIELGFDYLYGIHGMAFDKLYFYYGEKENVIEDTILIKELLFRKIKDNATMINFLSYNISILFSLIKDYLTLVKDREIYVGKYYIASLKRDIEKYQKERQQNQYDFEKKIRHKDDSISRLIKENENKDKRITRLSLEVDRLKEQVNETIALRNYIYNLNSEEDTYNDEGIDWNKIDRLKGVIIGGNDNWQKHIKEKLPTWSFISASTNYIDKSLISNARYVFVNTSFVGHSMYYSIVSTVQKSGCVLGYINSYNQKRVYNEIIHQIMI